MQKTKKPIIGLCVSSKLKPEFVGIIPRRIERYIENEVSFISFEITDLNFVERNVKGCIWEKEKNKIKCRQGILDFPDVIFLQCHVDTQIVERMEKVIGKKVFNSFIFDKWQCWKLLMKDQYVRSHLPKTSKMEHEMDLKQALMSYDDLFLKPIQGHSSIGIFRVKQSKEDPFEASYLEIYEKEKKLQKKTFASYLQLKEWIQKEFPLETFIIQQSIHTIKFGGKVTDIRLNMSRNDQGEWSVSLSLLRVASNDSHITPKGIFAMPLHDWNRIFPYQEKTINIENAVQHLGFQICRALDLSGFHFADVGIDLGVDSNGDLWVFEVNPLPHPIKLKPPLLDYSWTRPVEYALYLASREGN